MWRLGKDALWWIVRVGVALLLGSLAGCHPHLNLTATTPGTGTTDTINLGLIGAAAGPGAVEGSYTGDATQLAVTTINANGGVAWQGHRYQLALKYGNGSDVTSMTDGLLAATPPILALLGPDESDAALTASVLAGRAGVPELTIAVDPALTAPSQGPATLFRVRPPATAWAQAIASYAATQAHPHGLAIATLDDDFGRTGLHTIETTLAQHGLAPVANVLLTPGLLDASLPAAAVQGAQADAVLCWSTAPEAAQLLHRLRAIGWQGQWLMGMIDGDFVALAGNDGAGSVGAINWAAGVTTPANQNFISAFQQHYGMVPDEHAAAAYDAVQLVAGAIAAVGPQRDAVANYLAHLHAVSGLQGTFDSNVATTLGTQGDLSLNLVLVRVHDGVMVPLN